MVAHVIKNWNAVFKIESKRIDVVVDNQNIIQIDVSWEYAQVFDVHVWVILIKLASVLSEESMLDKSVVRIQKVDDFVSKPFISCSENGHLIIFVDELQTLSRERPNWETCGNMMTSRGVQNRYLLVSVEVLVSVIELIDAASAVNKGFI